MPAAAPLRNFASNIACRDSSHIDALSADDEPSTPMPTCTPAAIKSMTGATPDDKIKLLLGQCATPIRAEPSRLISCGFGITQ
ncbi:unannotated protein [freshwater metagenome]|uniref:Unannotated protein n=1 Tax=freshwater metagenome TaxID=449393 RepID=A0A6J7PJM8_9ZZZZ